jgi:hypothetical protein
MLSLRRALYNAADETSQLGNHQRHTNARCLATRTRRVAFDRPRPRAAKPHNQSARMLQAMYTKAPPVCARERAAGTRPQQSAVRSADAPDATTHYTAAGSAGGRTTAAGIVPVRCRDSGQLPKRVPGPTLCANRCACCSTQTLDLPHGGRLPC